MPEPMQPLLTVRDVAELLRCSNRHIHRMKDAGRIPAPLRAGGLLRWRRSAIELWLADGCPSCSSVGRVKP